MQAPSRGVSSLGVEACSVERYAFQLNTHALLKAFKTFFKSEYERVYGLERVSCEIDGLENVVEEMQSRHSKGHLENRILEIDA